LSCSSPTTACAEWRRSLRVVSVSAEKSHDDLAARLYLQAVLPAMEELARVSPRARALIAGWDCSVEFAVAGQGGAAVSFKNGVVSVLRERCRDAAISLWFVSSRQLVSQFTGQGFSLPLPRRGIFRLAGLYRFHRVGKILEAELEQHPRLLLSVALGSLSPLIEHDAQAREWMRDCPAGVAEFGVPASGLFGWVEWRNSEIKWGRGRAARTADVEVHFRDERIALAALRGELDEWAAIGAGDLTVRGLVPLAEALGAVMERAEYYMVRKKTGMEVRG
jgi:hypothetical protein